MKKFIKITTMAIVIIISSVLLVSCNRPVLATSENPFGLEVLGDVRPEGEKIDLDDLEVDLEDDIALAFALYQLANLNDKNAPHRAMYSICPTSNVAMTLDNKILLNILEIKNGNEFFRIDYRLEEDIPIFGIPGISKDVLNKALALVTTERRYTNVDMDHTIYQIIKNAQTTENGVPYAIWKDKDITELTDPEAGPSEPRIFNASQEGTYNKSAHTVNLDTILEASVDYDAEGGFYFVSITLDMDNAESTEHTRPLIQEGSGAPNAKFNEIILEFKIWDNGYYKEFWQKEKWNAKLKLFSLEVSSVFEYHDVYSYDAKDCDISKYYKNGEFVDYTKDLVK